MFGKTDTAKLKRALFESSLHVPKHELIDLPSEDDGAGWAASANRHLWIFSRCARFHDYVHQSCPDEDGYDAGPWRLEQRGSPYLTLVGFVDGPVVGVRYGLFYNSCAIGALEIEPLFALEGSASEGFNPAALHVSIDHASLLPHQHVRGLLRLTAGPFDFDRAREHRRPVDQEIASVMLECLWNANRSGSASIRFQYDGALRVEHPFPGLSG